MRACCGVIIIPATSSCVFGLITLECTPRGSAVIVAKLGSRSLKDNNHTRTTNGLELRLFPFCLCSGSMHGSSQTWSTSRRLGPCPNYLAQREHFGTHWVIPSVFHLSKLHAPRPGTLKPRRLDPPKVQDLELGKPNGYEPK